jgi:regulator of nucleoside diphosphate kinase
VEGRIVVSQRDLLRLRALLGAHARTAASDRGHLLELEEEIERATIVGADALPTDVVALESTVLVLDVESGSRASYTLVLPAHAEIAEGRVSVLAPLGTALLGCRAGDEVEQHTPGGLRRLHIQAVQHPPPNGDEPRERRVAA